MYLIVDVYSYVTLSARGGALEINFSVSRAANSPAMCQRRVIGIEYQVCTHACVYDARLLLMRVN